MAYDFNYDLFALTPDKFRSRWAPSLKDFNDEEILRMRASATPPTAPFAYGVVDSVGSVTLSTEYVTAYITLYPKWGSASVKKLFLSTAEQSGMAVYIHGGAPQTIHGPFISVEEADFVSGDECSVLFYANRLFDL